MHQIVYDKNFYCMELYDKQFVSLSVNPGMPSFSASFHCYKIFLLFDLKFGAMVGVEKLESKASSLKF